MKRFFILSFFILSFLFLHLYNHSSIYAKGEDEKIIGKKVKKEIGGAVIDKQKKLIEAVNKKLNDAEQSLDSHEVDTTNAGLTHFTTLILGANFDDADYTEEEIVAIKQELGVGSGAIPTIGNAIAYMYESPPASVQSYIADVFQNAKIIPSAYAQGLGFGALHPVLSVWKTFLQLSYAFLAVVILIIGFMIMFRAQIGGQTAVTAQQAIPNVIIALIAITLSYPIAGVMIELMYLLMQLMIVVFKPESGVDLISFNFLELGGSFLVGKDAVWSPISETVSQFVDSLAGENILSSALGFASSILVNVIYAIAILVMIFKLFFLLLKSYITIVLNVALAPMILMVGAIPGKNTFTNWIKQIAGHLLAFPTVLLVIILYQILTEGMVSGGGFMPPYLIGGGVGDAPIFLIGLGLLLAMPAIVKEVVNAIAPESSFFTSILKEAGDTMKKGLRYGAPVAGGLAYGTAGGIHEAYTGEGPWPASFISGFKNKFGKGVQKGTDISRTAEQAFEGNLFDPNNMVNAVLAQERRARDEKDQEKITERRETGDPDDLSS